jgi:hypothetical protein
MSIMNIMNNNEWHCDTCDKTIKRKSKSGHLKSKTHLSKLVHHNPTHKDCDVCYEAKLDFKSCIQCVHTWCVDCHSKITKCPFCRKELPTVRQIRESEPSEPSEPSELQQDPFYSMIFENAYPDYLSWYEYPENQLDYLHYLDDLDYLDYLVYHNYIH